MTSVAGDRENDDEHIRFFRGCMVAVLILVAVAALVVFLFTTRLEVDGLSEGDARPLV